MIYKKVYWKCCFNYFFFARKSDADRLDQIYDIAIKFSEVNKDYEGLLNLKNITNTSSLNNSALSAPRNYTEYDYIEYINYPNEQGMRDQYKKKSYQF